MDALELLFKASHSVTVCSTSMQVVFGLDSRVDVNYVLAKFREQYPSLSYRYEVDMFGSVNFYLSLLGVIYALVSRNSQSFTFRKLKNRIIYELQNVRDDFPPESLQAWRSKR
jgi:hypothetical protein